LPSSGSGYDDLRSKMEGCGGAEKFWSFDPKLPNGPPYRGAIDKATLIREF